MLHFMRKQILRSERWFTHVVFLAEKTERRETKRFDIRETANVNILTSITTALLCHLKIRNVPGHFDVLV